MTTLHLAPRRPRLRPLAFGAASVAIVAATYLAVALGPPRMTPAPPMPIGARDVALTQPQPALASGTDALLSALDHEIDLWDASLAANDGDYIAATRLGSLHLQRARITGDLGDYERALVAADRAVTADRIFWPGHSLRATVLFALHDFAAARKEAAATVAADASQLDALAVVGDASLELGDLEAAEDAYARLAAAAPSAPVWSRMAHLAFLTGDVDAAVELIVRCIASVDAADDPTGAAFYHYQLGEVSRLVGDVSRAETAFEDALSILDGYVPAQAGLALVREARGRRGEAIGLLETAAAANPQPELVAALGDLYALSGDPARAEDQYALVERIGDLARASGGVYDRQLILFAADLGRGVDAAVVAAEASLAQRRDVYGLDAYGWALFAAGRVTEADAALQEALELGTPDVRIAYHAGMAAAAAGRISEARDLLGRAVAARGALPPLQAERAAATLAALGTGARLP